MKSKSKVTPEEIIHFIRGHKVMMDHNLAKMYGITDKKLIEAVEKNCDRFPDDFMFQLNQKELSSMKMAVKKAPYAFTEQGVAMLSSIIKSPRAVEINIEIVHTFVIMRRVMSAQEQIGKELGKFKSFLAKHTHASDREFRKIWRTLERLGSSEQTEEERRIGFQLD